MRGISILEVLQPGGFVATLMREAPRPELGYVPEGGSTRRCETCDRDISVVWLVCAISQLHPEEKFMLWRPKPASDLPEDEYIELNRQLWGHDVDSRWLHRSGYFEWYTPEPVVEAARKAMGEIDLDPASCAEANKVVKATKFYTMKENGLEQPWAGRIFLNPPFKADIIQAFSDKLIRAYESNEIEQAVFLCNASTDSKWWHNVMERSGLVCLPRRRVKFYGPKKGSPGHIGTSLFYFGDHIGRFGVVFSQFGMVVGDARRFVIDMYEDEEEAGQTR